MAFCSLSICTKAIADQHLPTINPNLQITDPVGTIDLNPTINLSNQGGVIPSRGQDMIEEVVSTSSSNNGGQEKTPGKSNTTTSTIRTTGTISLSPFLTKCQDLDIDSIYVNESIDDFSLQQVSGCPGTKITNLFFTDQTAERLKDYGTEINVEFKLKGQPWQEFSESSPIKIPEEGYFMVRTNIVRDTEADDGDAFKLTAKAANDEVAEGYVTLVDPTDQSRLDAMDFASLIDAIETMNPDEMSPKEALEAIYALQALIDAKKE